MLLCAFKNTKYFSNKITSFLFRYQKAGTQYRSIYSVSMNELKYYNIDKYLHKYDLESPYFSSGLDIDDLGHTEAPGNRNI